MPRYATAQSLSKYGGRGLDPAACKACQPQGIGLARDQGLDHGPSAGADDIGDHRVELDIGFFQCLLQTLNVACALARQLLARAQQPALLLRLDVRHKARADEPMGEEISQPK